MALPIARAAGNRARANPRMYSTTSEASFAHRNTPPMPEPAFVNPALGRVTLLSHSLHSILGSALRSLTMPITSWLPMMQKAAVAPLVQVAEQAVPIVETGLRVVFEGNQERGWSWNHEGGPVALYNIVHQKPDFHPKNSKMAVDEYQRAYELSSMVPTKGYLAFTATSQAMHHETHPLRSRQTQENEELNATHSVFYELTRPHVALIRLPSQNYRGLDDNVSFAPPEVHIEPVPLHPVLSSPQAQLVTAAIVATSVAAVSSVVAIKSFLQKPW